MTTYRWHLFSNDPPKVSGNYLVTAVSYIDGTHMVASGFYSVPNHRWRVYEYNLLMKDVILAWAEFPPAFHEPDYNEWSYYRNY